MPQPSFAGSCEDLDDAGQRLIGRKTGVVVQPVAGKVVDPAVMDGEDPVPFFHLLGCARWRCGCSARPVSARSAAACQPVAAVEHGLKKAHQHRRFL